MSAREALLIGVSECADLPDLALPVVHRDIEEMQRALASCDYKVRTLGVENPADATRNTIRRAIREACTTSIEGGTLIVYFSGHGIHYNGKDLLIPYDADLGTDLSDTLVSADIAEMVAKAPAATVLFFIDACREGVNWQEKAGGITGWSSAEYLATAKRGFVTVYGCSAGQVSQYVSGNDGFSLFSRALSTVLAPGHGARKIDEILRSAQHELDRLIVAHGKRPQAISWKAEQSVETEWSTRVISDYRSLSVGAKGEADWAEVVRNSRLWLPSDTDEPDDHRSVYRGTCATLVREAQREMRRAVAALPHDPWRDVTYPLRVVEQLEHVITQGNFSLTAAETSLLLLGPFLLEASYAQAVCELAAYMPLRITVSPENNAWSIPPTVNGANASIDKSLRLLHNTRPRLVRAAARLSRGKKREQERSEMIAAWLMHEFIGREPTFWRSIPPSLKDHFSTIGGGDAAFGSLVLATLDYRRLLSLARFVGGDPARVERSDSARPLERVAVVTAGNFKIEIREQLIAYLLVVAGWMALDCRTMPEIVAAHVAVDGAFSSVDLIRPLRDARWQPFGSARQLVVLCDHPAADYAIRDHVRRASETLEYIRGRCAESPHLAALADLPTRLTDEGIHPVRLADGRRSYELPHFSFTVDPDEVRELLMGQQLYADPDLAIRELYQNALDACRYADARLEYLRRRNECPAERRDWQGTITFRYGRADDGRRFLECVDTGVGMGKPELASCFAKAGRRFRDLPEFLEEQEQWFGCQPPVQMYPNSRFGVGVFSYFMLADDIEVETCRLDRQGRLGSRLMARMSAGGAVFRITDEGLGSVPGTRVRLYLKTKRKAGFIADTLSKHLVIAEYLTSVFDGRHQRSWHPGIPGSGKHRYEYASPSGDRNLWWVVAGAGEILADGIRVGHDPTRSPVRQRKSTDLHESLRAIGALINLTNDHFPLLTIDRKIALKVDEEWIAGTLANQLATLHSSRLISMVQLWSVQHYFPHHVSQLLSRFEDVPRSINVGLNKSANALFDDELYYRLNFADVPRIARALPNVRPDRLGIDKRDLAIFAISSHLHGNFAGTRWYRLSRIEEALKAFRWIRRHSFREFDRHTNNPVVALHELLSRAGTLNDFAERLRAWVAEGFNLHPILAALLVPLDQATYLSYRREMRRYRRRQVMLGIRAFFLRPGNEQW